MYNLFLRVKLIPVEIFNFLNVYYLFLVAKALIFGYVQIQFRV